MVDEETIQRLWKLTNELSAQLAANRDFTQVLRNEVVDLRTRAEIKILDGELDDEDDGFECMDGANGTLTADQATLAPSSVGSSSAAAANPALLRKYHELQRQHKVVVAQNQYFEQECAQLQLLVRDYEAGLEAVTSKFRSHAYILQQGKLLMQRDYEALLEEERRTSSALLADNLSMQHGLSQLSSLIRQAYDADNDFSSNVLVEQLLVENRSLREMLGIAEHVEARSSAATTYPVSQPHRGPPQRGFSVFSAPVRDYFANGEVEAQDGKAPQVATNGAAEPAGTMRGESVGM